VDRYTPVGAAPDPSAFDPPPDDRMLAVTVADVLERVARATERYDVLARTPAALAAHGA